MASPEPSNLAELRPDIAAMQTQIPVPGPSSVDMQAAVQREEQPRAYFTYDGQRYELNHAPDAFDLADLAEYMGVAQENPIAALGGINRCLRTWLVDFPSLRAAFRKRNAGLDVEGQMSEYGAISAALFEATTARPTEAPAGSSDGRTPTSTSSRDGSPSPAASPSTAPSGSATSTPG